MSNYQTPPAYQPQMPPKGKMTRRHKAVLAIVASIAVVLVVIVAAAIGAAPQTTTGHPSASGQHHAKVHPVVHHAAPKPKMITLATFKGSGDDNTAKFAVSGTWKLKWHYDCSSFGQAGNFAVLEDGGADSALNLNQLGKGGHGQTYAYSDSGRHFLQVSSECTWTVKVVGSR